MSEGEEEEQKIENLLENIMKENIEGTHREGKETGTQINNLEQKEEINIHLVQNEETRVQKKWEV